MKTHFNVYFMHWIALHGHIQYSICRYLYFSNVNTNLNHCNRPCTVQYRTAMHSTVMQRTSVFLGCTVHNISFHSVVTVIDCTALYYTMYDVFALYSKVE